MIYLLDTNVVAELTTRRAPHPRVVAWLHATPRPSRYLSVLTLAEIDRGVRLTQDPLRKARYAAALEQIRRDYAGRVAAVGEPEAAAFLALHQRLKAVGRSIDPPDALLAATALARGWTLVTRNGKHLDRTGATLLNPWDD